MPLTREFKETIRARVERDPKFRKELLREGVESMLTGDIATAKTILRDYINATVGFTELAEATNIPSKSLMRMLGPGGNPRAANLFEVISFLQNREGLRFLAQGCTPVKSVSRQCCRDSENPRQWSRLRRKAMGEYPPDISDSAHRRGPQAPA
jgi:DNA-binding phage protein